MIIIALPQEAKRAVKITGKVAPWCYLGKDFAGRERTARTAGEDKRVYLKGMLHKKAAEIGQDFIEFVAALGEKQASGLEWWASKFASKRFMQTDFFLLVCYKAVAVGLIEENMRRRDLIIFIEDPWLFTDLMRVYKKEEIIFLGRHDLPLVKAMCALRGIMHRFIFALWFVMARVLVRIYHKGKRPAGLKAGGPAVAIINPAERRAFRDGQYVDNYLPGLPALYASKGISTFHIYLLRCPLSTIRSIGLNRDELWPVILNAGFLKVLTRLFEYWRPDLKDARLKIGKYDISVILERERWIEFSSAGFNVHLALFDALDGFFQKKWCSSVVYTFENQPWEKMLCMAASKNGVRAIGYQHSSIWKLYLSQFIGKHEHIFAPLPYRLITSGRRSAGLYKEGGMPEGKVVVGGAWRYVRDREGSNTRRAANDRPGAGTVVLVSLSLDVAISKSMLKSISKAVLSVDPDRAPEIWVKPHPGSTAHELKKLGAFISGFKTVTGSFSALLNDVDAVVASESTCGLEAFLEGKKAVSYIPENLLAADPLMDAEDERIYLWYEGEDLKIDFLTHRNSSSDLQDLDRIKRDYFDDIDREKWIGAVAV